MESEKMNQLKEKIKGLEKFKLIDIIATYAYFYNSLEKSKYALSTLEIELLMNCIYETKAKEEKTPSAQDVQKILELTKNIVEEERKIDKMTEPIYAQYAKTDFLYSKEDKKQNEILDEYEKLFHPMKEYFLEQYQFTIQDFIKSIQIILQEYSKRMNLLEMELRKLKTEEILPEQFLECLTSRCYSILNFNCDTFSKDLREIIPFQHFLEKFSHSLDNTNPNFKTSPIVKKGNTYIAIWLNTLSNYAKTIFEKEISENPEVSTKYGKHKGQHLEEETKNVLQGILKNAEIFPSVKYSDKKRAGETDLLVIFDHNIIIVEIKNRKWKEKSKEGEDYFIQQDMNENLYKAYQQATRTENYICNHSEVKFRIGDTKKTLTISNTEKFAIYKLGITLENLRTYAVLYDKYNPEIEKDMVFFNINDLKEIAKYIEYQTEFIHYLDKRIKCNQYLENYYFYNELYLFSEYKFYNLESILTPREGIRFWDIGRDSLFDHRFRKEEKLEILQRKELLFMKLMMKRIEEDRMPDYANVMMSLLEIDLKGQKRIQEGIKEARQKYQAEGKEAIFFFTVEEEKDLKGIIILIVVSKEKSENVEQFAMIYGAAVKRKYPTYDVIIWTNYTTAPEYLIDNCIYMKNVKEEADAYIEKIPELKNLELFLP